MRMKKLLTFLTLLTLFFGVGWADEVTYTFTSKSWEATPANWIGTADGNQFNTSGTPKGVQVTTGAGSGATITCPVSYDNISKVEVTYSSSSKAVATISVSIGTFQIGQYNVSKSLVETTLTYTPNSPRSGVVSFTPTVNTNSIGINSVKIYYTPGGSTTYNVTLNQSTGGTISASPTTAAEGATVTLTATPDSGYGFTSWTVLDENADEVTVTNNQFTMPASDVEVEATFTELTTRAITVIGGTASPASAYAGQTVTVTPTIPDGKVVDQITTVPASLTLTASGTGYTFTMPNEAVTVTFTFKDAPVQSNRFQRITSTNDLEKDARYLIVYEGQTPAVMGAVGTYGESVTGTSNFSYTDGVIVLTSATDAKPLTLGGSSGAWTFELDGGSLIGQNGKNSLALGGNNTTWAISFDETNKNATISHSVSGTTYNIEYNNSASPKRFAGYAGTQEDVYLYKETSSTTSNKLYLIGYGMNGKENWDLTTAPEMTESNGVHSVDVYFDRAARGLFQFAKGLSNSDSNWGGLSGRLYPSTNGSNVNVDLYDMNGTVGLWFTDNSNAYSFELPAGLYTIKANLSEWKTYVTQKDVTMEIKPASATFTTTKEVTMESNLTQYGGKIYYTTDGSDPSASSTEYTGTITLDATTTIKAIAILNYIQSEVVEKTYTKLPAAPVITPNGGTIYEATQVTITAESGATIYYTTDGSDPTNESTQYNGPFTVSATTTVKARAYVGDTYSNVTTAEFTYSDVQPSTGDFVLVTSASQLVAGNEYIIMTKDPTDYTLAMGDIVSSKGSWTQQFGINGNVGAAGSTVSVYSESTSTTQSLVNILELENTNGKLSLKQQSAGTYLNITSSTSTNISASSSKTYLTIEIDEDNYWATIQGTSSRQILFSGQNDVFGNYSTSNADASNFSKVYLYTRESNSVQPPVFTPAGGVYDVPVDVTISCATTGASIYYTTDGTEPSATNGTLYNGEEFMVSENTTFKAVAVKNGNTSSVVTAEYTITPHTAIETVTLDYSEPFTAGIGKFVVENVSGYSPVWTLDGNYGIKGTAYNANTNPTNNAAVSRFLSPIIDMTDATQPELTFSHQINAYFTNVTNQCQLFIRETTNGTDGTWVQLPITFSDPVAAGGWTNDVVDIDLSTYAGKKVQISFLYTNPTAGSGAGTWEIQNFVVADNSEYKMVNNIAEFLALENGTKAKFRNPVTVLYDYAQYSSNSYHEYIWVKDESGYMQFYLIPTLNSGTSLDDKAAYYENGDIIPAGFVVVKNYYENGKYVQAFSAEALEAGFEVATQKGLADPEYMDFDVLDDLDASNTTDVANWSNHYITLEKIKLTSSSKNFNFQDENGTTNSCVGYNKYNGDGSLLKGGTTSADVIMPTDLTKYYNVKAILQLWQGGWEIMPIEFTEWKPAEVTLRKLCADGVEQNTYTISNPLQVVYVDTDRKSVWVKDGTGQSIWSTSPEAPNAENFAIEYASNTRSQQAYYDQSNWCQLVFDDEIPNALVNLPIINGGMITGKFTNKMNPTLENVEFGENFVQTESSSYATNYYVAANFNGPQLGYFFMNPKPQEYADIVWAIYDSSNQTMIMTNNSNKNPEGFEGSFKVNMSMNVNPSLQLVDGTQTGKGYEHFHAIIRLASTATSNAPMLKDRMPANTEYVVYPLDITQDVPTGITDVNGKAVKSVKYVNVAGMVSDKPFSGVNIVVTEYTDGSRSTTKMLRK